MRDSSFWCDAARGPNRELFLEEFDDFLPQEILDFHVHLINRGVIPDGDSFSCAGHPISSYDLQEFEEDMQEWLPNRTLSAVCFGFPHVAYDSHRNNEYIARACDRERFFALRLLDPMRDDEETLRDELVTGGFYGIKPYPDYVRKEDINEVEIHEMLPAWAMEIVNELGLIVMLHIPRRARLADPLNQQQIVELCERYENARIVLAHIGRAYYLKCVRGNLDMLKSIPNLYFDLAMLNHWEVMEYLFNEVAPEKILYGSDAPIAIAPGKSVEINDLYTYVTPKAWELSISDDHGKLHFTSFLYEELRAIKRAVERSHLDRVFVQKIFYENGARLLHDIGSERIRRD